MSPEPAANSYRLTRFVFQRLLAFVYLMAFLIALHQYVPLVGERGILPMKLFLKQVRFWDAPGLFWFNPSDPFIRAVAWGGVALSAIALAGFSDAFGPWVSAAVWTTLWIFYQSFVNAGQLFYGFGWEMLLLETGFLAIFLGPSNREAPAVVLVLLRWILFRVMFGAGLIKLRGDACWLDLTCLSYHYETQPLPNPMSWYLHKLPLLYHKAEVLFTHFVELAIPWGYFWPRRLRIACGAGSFFFQVMLIVSGNLSWLNYITLVLCIACFDDALLSCFLPLKTLPVPSMGRTRRGFLYGLAGLILLLSIPPAVNLVSPVQLMNASFEPLHLVNTYGAFGSVTRKRNEIILEGTADAAPDEASEWRAYEFRCKPGDPARRPCVVSPYHYRLDWQIWFAAMNDFRYNPWMLSVIAKLLQGDRGTLTLFERNPFASAPPKFIRALLYEYRFTTPEERRRSGAWWSRQLVQEYLPPLSLDNPGYRRILAAAGWLE